MNKSKKHTSLIIGGDSVIGCSLGYELSRQGDNVFSTTRRETFRYPGKSLLLLDLKEDVTHWEIPKPVNTAYICAAATSLDHSRKNPEQTRQINVDRILRLAEIFADRRIRVVFLSTNLVFKGDTPFAEPNSPVCPQTEYGRQKADAEAQLLAMGELVSVLRLTKVIPPDMPLLNGWTQTIKSGDVIRPFSDFVMAPVSLSLTVKVLIEIGLKRLPGIIQLSASRDITYEEAGRHVAERLNAEHLVQPVLSKEVLSDVEAIPSHTTMDTSRLVRELGIKSPDPLDAVNSILELNNA